MLAVGDGRAEDPVRPVPDLLPGERVERVGAPFALLGVSGGDAPARRTSREVDEPVDHARCAVDGRRCGEAPEPVAGGGIEGHEVPVVGADVDASAPDRSGGVDVRARTLRPQQPPAGGAEGVERPVGIANEDPPVGDRRGRVEVFAASEAGERRRAPPLAAGARIERIEAAGIGPEVDPSAAVGGRAVDLAISGERPTRLAAVDVDRVQLVIPGAGIERPADHERRGFEGTAASERPDELPGPRRHRGDDPRLAAGVAVAGQRLHPGVVDDAVGDRRRGGGAVVETALPDDLPRAVVDGIEVPPLLGQVEPAVRDRRRELEHVACLEDPPEAERRLEFEVGCGVRALHLQAVGRPGQPQDDLPRPLLLRRLLRRHELLR